MKKTLFSLLTAFILLSCNNPIDKKVNITTAKEDIQQIREKYKNDYTDADFDALGNELAGGLFRTAMTKGDVKDVKFDKTYKEYLDEAKKLRLEKEKLAEAAKKAEAEKKAKMDAAAVVSIYGYTFHKANSDNFEFRDYHTFKYAIQNKSSKEIKALKFHFNIYNALGDELGKGYEMSVTDDRIAPSSTYQNSMMFESNSYSSEDNKIASAKFEDLKFDIVIDKIVYSDGSEL